MSKVLVLYYSRGGHTAQISRTIAQHILAKGGECDVVNINDVKGDIDWTQYHAIALGACVLYGSYHAQQFLLR
jgi:menaquinone-dependent protoporphyrinogen oxidase